MSDDPVRLSLKLCAILDGIGVSENMREVIRATCITSEIARTITYRMIDLEESTYYFGSSCEGTTTPGMGFDIDKVMCNDDTPVIEDIWEAPAQGTALLMITSRHTRPGYTKLQEIYNGTPLTINNYIRLSTAVEYQHDCEGRICLKHITAQGTITAVNERNGPADTMSNDPYSYPVDIVNAMRCRTFPHIASESLNKCNACGWIPEIDVDRMKRFGILLVGIGHEASDERDIEWSLSFSLQERHLMFALNSTQHKCYVLLKLIKNIITARPNVGKSLTSYHCKTCLFTVITDTGMALWTEDNLINCTFRCLTQLHSWISSNYCPNFFIKENNMFERKYFVEAQERLVYNTQLILDEWPMLLYHIESDHIGDAMQGRLIYHTCTYQMYETMIRACERITRCQYHILDFCLELGSNQHIEDHLFKQLCYLQNVDTITEHTQEQTQTAVRHLEPILHKLYAQQVASMAFSTEDSTSRSRKLEISCRHLNIGKKCDRMSGNLLEATILYRTGNVGSCCSLLEQVERRMIHEEVCSLCKCYGKIQIRNHQLRRNISIGNIDAQNIMELALAPCMMFLPSQSEIIPKALQYEMYRSIGADPETRDFGFHEWYDLVVIDCKIYLHFLQYLVYSDLNNPISKQMAIDHIWKVIAHDDNLGHIETAYNLLGWIYTQEGRIQEAVSCFVFSWRIRPDHNAARWHLPALLIRLRGT